MIYNIYETERNRKNRFMAQNFNDLKRQLAELDIKLTYRYFQNFYNLIGFFDTENLKLTMYNQMTIGRAFKESLIEIVNEKYKEEQK